MSKIFLSLLKSPWVSRSLIALSILLLLNIFLPVLWVEAKYQVRQASLQLFGTSQLASIILPNFKQLDLKARSKYREYGIYIPELGIDEPVVFNVDPNNQDQYTEALSLGIAHASGTAFPDSGRLGYYFAHSSTPDLKIQLNAIFYLLGKLKPEDEVFIWHEGKRYDYLVVEQRITEPGDVSFLEPSQYDQETIVLQTCWPPGTTLQRMLVFAQRES